MGAPSYVRTRATTHAQRDSIPIELAVWSRPVQGREAETSREGPADPRIMPAVVPGLPTPLQHHPCLHPIDVCQCSKYPSGWRVMAVTA